MGQWGRRQRDVGAVMQEDNEAGGSEMVGSGI
jgi:hypothetical protein